MTEYQFYSLITVILFFKMLANSVVQALGPHQTRKPSRIPKTRASSGYPRQPRRKLPVVKRAAAVWRNDLENIPIFLFLAIDLRARSDAGRRARTFISRIFTVARILHTVVYMQGMQPCAHDLLRASELAICVTMSIQILIAVL